MTYKEKDGHNRSVPISVHNPLMDRDVEILILKDCAQFVDRFSNQWENAMHSCKQKTVPVLAYKRRRKGRVEHVRKHKRCLPK